ncbi:MAG: hypothetical protein AAGE38_15420 [Pseudomonadota bacterium]
MNTDLGSQTPLGVARVIGDTFGLFFSRLPLFILLALLPTLVVTGLQFAFLPEFISDDPILFPGTGVGFVAYSALSLFFFMIMVGVITLAAYDVRLGREANVVSYVWRTIKAIPAIFILTIPFYIMIVAGLLLLIIPAFYLMARYWVFTPVILIEGSGYRGLLRASELSRGYRWPIVAASIGIILVSLLLAYLVHVPLMLMLGLDLIAFPGTPNYTMTAIVQSFSSAIQYALLSIFTALLYARLREIKEGLGMEDLAEVFR